MSPGLTLRDHARGAIRDEVAKHAWTLFAEHGYEATTVDQIAEAAGMSRRTFFRYFAGKDELVLERLVESGQTMAETLRSRPADEDAWTALRAAFQVAVDLQETHADKARPLQVMLREEPALRATAETRRRLWIERLSPLTALRLPAATGSGPDLRAAAVTGSALACLDAAQATWAANPGARLSDLLDDAMSAVAPLT
ncbi:MAG: TetR family transcriptional regulator [Aeromicrobium sp.]